MKSSRCTQMSLMGMKPCCPTLDTCSLTNRFFVRCHAGPLTVRGLSSFGVFDSTSSSPATASASTTKTPFTPLRLRLPLRLYDCNSLRASIPRLPSRLRLRASLRLRAPLQLTTTISLYDCDSLRSSASPSLFRQFFAPLRLPSLPREPFAPLRRF